MKKITKLRLLFILLTAIIFSALDSNAQTQEEIAYCCSDSVEVEPENAGQPGVWTIITEGTTTMISKSNSIKTVFYNLFKEKDTVSVKWQWDQGEVTVLLIDKRVTSDAGKDMTVCQDTIELSAKLKSSDDFGEWSVLSAEAQISNSLDPNAEVTLGKGTNILRWMVSNDICTDTDDVQITNNNVEAKVLKNNIEINCGSSATLQAVEPVIGTGKWMLTSDNAYITDPNSSSTEVVGIFPNTQLEAIWQVVNEACTNEASVTINNKTTHVKVDKTDVTSTSKGGITLTLEGPNAQSNTSFKWSNGTTTKDLTDIPPGEYTVIVTDNFNCEITKTVTIKRKQTEECDIVAGFKSTVDANTITLENLSTGTSIDGYYWYLGDGTFINTKDSTKTVEHEYEKSGVYAVCLIAFNIVNGAMECVDKYCEEIVVGEVGCSANFDYSTDVTQPKTVHFSSNSIGEGLKLQWVFGDGATSTGAEPIHSYEENGLYQVKLTVIDEQGCVSQAREVIQIGNDICLADFAYYVEKMENTDEYKVYFADLSLGNVDKRHWDFNNGYSASEAIASTIYEKPGVYEVCLTVYNKFLDKNSTLCRKIYIGEGNCEAKFVYHVDEETNMVTFESKSLGEPDIFYWTLGDGTFKVNDHFSYEYSEAGTYEVCLRIGSSKTGCIASFCDEITIGDVECKAGFSTFVDSETNTVKFFDESEGNIAGRFWNFGDGKTEFKLLPRTVEHTYEKPGTYNVQLSVKGLNECTDIYSEEIQVGDIECLADFKYQIKEQTVNFNNKSQGVELVNYYWDFGDNTTSTEENPVHEYEESGVYKVTLTVSDEYGICMNKTRQMVQVGAVNCSAKFHVYVDSDKKNAHFRSKALGTTTLYEWDFGDGGTSNERNPVHEFKTSGYFTVKLKVKNDKGCMDEFSKTVLIGEENDDCEADFVYQVDADTRKVTFKDNSSGNPTGFLWDFGDKTTNVLQNPGAHQYTEYGIYNVCLSVMKKVDGELIKNMRCKRVVVAPVDLSDLCKANFVFTVDAASKTATLQDKSIGKPNRWLWSFADEEFNTAQVTHTFDEADYYTIRLQIENTVTGCKDVTYKTINVAKGNNGLKARFGYEIKESQDKARGYPIDCYGACFGEPSTYTWTVNGEVVDTTSTTPELKFSEPGNYEVCLTVVDPITKETSESCETILVEDPSAIEAIRESALHNNIYCYPNPMHNNTKVVFALDSNTDVDISVFDVSGRQVANILHEKRNAGKHELEWNASDLKAGIYYMKFSTDYGVGIHKLIVK